MRPCFGKEEKKAINEYMKTDGFITEFKQTEKFEQMIARYTGAKHCIVVNNGTISLTLAAMAVGIKAGDEVIVPNYTQIATPNSVKMFGAVPVFVDVEPETLCLDIERVRQAITPKTRLIIFVSANGRYPKSGIEAFEDLVRKHKIFLIEDAAQCLGSFYPDGRHIGRAGLVGSFSFSTPKIISTGQGGALITDDDVIASKLRRLKDFGRSGGGNDIHDSIGYNFKFTELQACIGIEQIKNLPLGSNEKRRYGPNIFANLIDTTGIKLFDHNLKYTTPWFIDAIADNRQALIDYLKARGIGTRVMYPPINKQKAYQIKGDYFVSYEIGDKGIWLPSAVQLKNSDIDRICKEINKFYK